MSEISKTIVKVCKAHGELGAADVKISIRSFADRPSRKDIICCRCRKDSQERYAEKNRLDRNAKERERHKYYYPKNREKILEKRRLHHAASYTPEIGKKAREKMKKREGANPNLKKRKESASKKSRIKWLNSKKYARARLIQMGFSMEIIPDALIEVKRAMLSLKRESRD